MATFSNSDPYLAIERALRAARRPSDEGPRARAMWDQYQADQEPYGNRPWKPTPGPVITEREVEAVADELGVSDEEAAELIRQTAQAARGDASDPGWMAQGLQQYAALNAAIAQAPTLRGIAETFSKVGKPETWSTPEKAALTPATPPTPQSVAPFSPAAVPSAPQSLEEFAAEMGRAQMAAANYNPQGIATEEAPGIETEPAEPADPAEEQGPEAQYEETDRTGLFASPAIGRAAAESPSRYSEMFTQPQSLLALLEPPTPAQAHAPAVQAARAGDPGIGRTPGFASRGLAAAAINPEEVGIPGPDIAGARAGGLAAGVGLPGLAYAPATPAFDVPTPALAYAPESPAFESVTTPSLAYAPGMPAFEEVGLPSLAYAPQSPAFEDVTTPAIAYAPQAPVAEVTGPALGYAPQAPVAAVTTPGLAYAPSMPAFDIEAEEADVPGPNMSAARAAAAAQAALSAPEFSVPAADLIAARKAAEAEANRRAAANELEQALVPTPLSTPNNASAVGRGVAGPANEMAAAQDYGFDPATIRAMTPGQRLSQTARGLTANTAPRSSPISGIVMHETFGVSGMPGGVIAAANERGAGYHYVIDIEGNVHQMVPENQTIAHIGDREVAAHSNSPFRNANTIGIGIQTHPGTRPNAAQMRAAAGLARAVAAKHGIDVTTGVVGHGDLAPRGQGPSAEGRSAVNALRGAENNDPRAETGPNRPANVDPLTRTTPGRRSSVEGLLNSILGISAANAAPSSMPGFTGMSTSGEPSPETFAPPAIAFIPAPTPGLTQATPEGGAVAGQGEIQGTEGAAFGPGAAAGAGLAGGMAPGGMGEPSAWAALATPSLTQQQNEPADEPAQTPAPAFATPGLAAPATPTTAVAQESPEEQSTEETSTEDTGRTSSFASPGISQSAVTGFSVVSMDDLDPATRAAVENAAAATARSQATEVGIARAGIPGLAIEYDPFSALQNVPNQPALMSVAIEQAARESEEAEDPETSFSTAFADPMGFAASTAGFGPGSMSAPGIGVGFGPEGMTSAAGMDAASTSGGMFGGAGLGAAAAETSASQMSSLGLDGVFGAAFSDPSSFGAFGISDTASTSSSEDSDDGSSTSSGIGADAAGAAADAAGVAGGGYGESDGPGNASDSGMGGSESGGSDGGGGFGGSADGMSGGGYGEGSGPGGDADSGGSASDPGGDSGGGFGSGMGGDDAGGGGWSRGGYVSDLAIARAMRAAEKMLRNERKYNRGGEVVYSSVDYFPGGLSYEQVVQRALRAAR